MLCETGDGILSSRCNILAMDPAIPEDYGLLKNELDKFDQENGTKAQRLYYLSVPPQTTAKIVECLGISDLAKHSNTKILLEKPFGRDLASAQILADHVDQYFKSEQVYRIDHFLAKETVQNIIVFRGSNALFKKTWNKDFIESIDIIASEKIGIEGRANFYEQTGALRDFIQSHLIQLAALVLMDNPRALPDIPRERLNALTKLKLTEPLAINSFRGQYLGYRDEVKNTNSTVETFVALTLDSSDPRWQGVPIRLITGKALSEKTTEIRIRYRKDNGDDADQLTLKIQPNEGVEICLWAKKPGYDNSTTMHELKFNFGDHYDKLPDAYERVILDAINSDHQLFASGQEVLEAWRIISPIQSLWQTNKTEPIIYPTGESSDKILAQSAKVLSNS
jgi:glucose-6-phosphate 1-dehydrogenase